MAAKTKISLQDAHELQMFLEKLAVRRLQTPDLKSAMMILRQHCDTSSALHEWTNSVAHKMRDRGLAFQAGAGLWIERFRLDTFFQNDVPQLEKIPIQILDEYIKLIQDPDFDFCGLDMDAHFSGGFSREESVASLKWMYRKVEKEGVYRLISKRGANLEDLKLMRFLLWQLESRNWGQPPFHFNKVLDDIIRTVERLAGPCKRVITKNGDLLAMHFLVAFHQTEVDLPSHRGQRKTRCFLTIDSTLSYNLSLNLGLYRRENGAWDSVELSQPGWSSNLVGSHSYTRAC